MRASTRATHARVESVVISAIGRANYPKNGNGGVRLVSATRCLVIVVVVVGTRLPRPATPSSRPLDRSSDRRYTGSAPLSSAHRLYHGYAAAAAAGQRARPSSHARPPPRAIGSPIELSVYPAATPITRARPRRLLRTPPPPPLYPRRPVVSPSFVPHSTVPHSPVNTHTHTRHSHYALLLRLHTVYNTRSAVFFSFNVTLCVAFTADPLYVTDL